MSGVSIGKSMGFCGHWGLSSSFDVVSGLNLSSSDLDANTTEPLNILLLQPGDIRHILTTISRRRRYRKNKNDSLRPIHFYLYETPIEILARDLLLLEVFNDYKVPIRQRANIFLEIFGNNKTQKRTCSYIEELAKKLILLLTKGVGQLSDTVDFSVLRYKERDMLEDAFKKYFKSFLFNIDSLYDHRQRGLYEDRFDSRKALYDWDYFGNFKKKASIVHIKQYKEWRHTGIAFEFGDQSYTEANKTLLSYTEGTLKTGKEKGFKKEIMGFWGDIVCSPYLSFGVDCEVPNKYAEGLFEILNKNSGTEQHRHHAVEVSLYNMFSLLWETETGQVYKMTKKNDIYSGLGAEASFLSNRLDGEVDEEEGAAAPKEGVTVTAGGAERGGVDPEDVRAKELAQAMDELTTEGAGEGKEQTEKEQQQQKQLPSIPEEELEQDASAAAGAAVMPPAPPTTTTTTTTTAAAGSEESLKKSKEKELMKAIIRAETIEESYRDIKIFPMSGSLSGTLDRAKYQNFFDVIFVSSRGAQLLSESYVSSLLKQTDAAGKGPYAAVETGKFVVPLSQQLIDELQKKEVELATALKWTQSKVPLVERRHRDELDTEDDVIFFQRL